MSFTTPNEWQAAYDAAERELNLAMDQGYMTYIVPARLKGMAQSIARAVILSANQDVYEGDGADIMDGEFKVEGVKTNGG